LVWRQYDPDCPNYTFTLEIAQVFSVFIYLFSYYFYDNIEIFYNRPYLIYLKENY